MATRIIYNKVIRVEERGGGKKTLSKQNVFMGSCFPERWETANDPNRKTTALQTLLMQWQIVKNGRESNLVESFYS